jgi:glutamate-5-semialdehyde dehydrogenase
VPLGVIGVIYEARPNVTIDCAALCIKSGNAAVLRGSADTLASNRALLAAVHAALASVGLPTEAVGLIDSPDRAEVEAMLGLNELIDLIIPRGGAALHQRCRQQSRIPVITGGIGICHLYAAASVEIDRALPLIDNAKTQRPSVCNALDTVLADRRIAAALLPALVERLAAKGVAFRAEPEALAIVGAHPAVQPAGPDDFDTEWLGLTLGLKVVDGVEAAIAHIQQHSTGHSDGILSADSAEVARFLHAVDSAAVYVNASTRFTDGSQFGLGAEIAVSTQRIHARGPMALEALTSYKWVVRGDYAVRP